MKRRKEREKKMEAQEKERKRQEGSEEGVGKRNKVREQKEDIKEIKEESKGSRKMVGRKEWEGIKSSLINQSALEKRSQSSQFFDPLTQFLTWW